MKTAEMNLKKEFEIAFLYGRPVEYYDLYFEIDPKGLRELVYWIEKKVKEALEFHDAEIISLIDEMITEYKALQKILEPDNIQSINDYECYIEVLKILKEKLNER